MNENLPFRPLDNSSSTRLRYKSEAQHWSEAYRSSQRDMRTTSVTEISGLIGALVTLVATAIIVIVTGLFWLIKKICQ